MPKVTVRTDMRGQAGLLSHYLMDEYKLKALPDISVSATEIEVTDDKLTDNDLKNALTKFRRAKHAGHPYKRALELLDKDKLTAEEDDELKHLHRQWFKSQLGGT